MRRVISGFLGVVLAAMATAAFAQGKPPLKLGGILDMSGLYADITGPGAETAAKMEAEDFGGEVLGRKIEIIAADHLNKADLSANIARDMLDNQGVEAIVDVAASATALAALEIAKAGTVVWNGPVGVFEKEPFADGTRTLARAIADSKAFSIAGGGDTVAAINKFGIADKIDYISTAGGAFLEFLEGKKLPAVEALEARATSRAEELVRDHALGLADHVSRYADYLD